MFCLPPLALPLTAAVAVGLVALGYGLGRWNRQRYGDQRVWQWSIAQAEDEEAQHQKKEETA